MSAQRQQLLICQSSSHQMKNPVMSFQSRNSYEISFREILLVKLNSSLLFFTELIGPLLITLIISWIGGKFDSISIVQRNSSRLVDRTILSKSGPEVEYDQQLSLKSSAGRVDLCAVSQSQSRDLDLVLQSIRTLADKLTQKANESSNEKAYKLQKFNDGDSAEIFLSNFRCSLRENVPDCVWFDQVNVSTGILRYKIRSGSMRSSSSWQIKATSEPSTNSQYSSRFIDLIYLVNRAFLESRRIEFNSSIPEIDLDIIIYKIPYPPYRMSVSAHHLDFVIVFYGMAFFVSFVTMVYRTSDENNKRSFAIERHFGQYWFTTITFYLLQVTLIGFFMISVLKIKMFSFSLWANSNYLLLLCVVFAYSLHLVTLGLLFSVVFIDRDFVTLFAAFSFVFTLFLPRYFFEPSERFVANLETMKLACILPNTALFLMLKVIILYECQGTGLTFKTFSQASATYNGLSVASILPIMACSSLISLLLTLYLDLVWPWPSRRKRLPLFFLCDKTFWMKRASSDSNDPSLKDRVVSNVSHQLQVPSQENVFDGQALNHTPREQSHTAFEYDQVIASAADSNTNELAPSSATKHHDDHQSEGETDEEAEDEGDEQSVTAAQGSDPILARSKFKSFFRILHLIFVHRINQTKKHRSLWLLQLILPTLLLGVGSHILAFFELGDSIVDIDYSFSIYPNSRVAIQTDGNPGSEEFKSHLVRTLEHENIPWYIVQNNHSVSDNSLSNHYRAQITSGNSNLERYIQENVIGLQLDTPQVDSRTDGSNKIERRITGWVNNEALQAVPLLLRLIFETQVLEQNAIIKKQGQITFSTEIYHDSEDHKWAGLSLASIFWICQVAISLSLIAASTIILPIDGPAALMSHDELHPLHPSLRLIATYISDLFLFFVSSIVIICGVFVLTVGRISLVDPSDYLAAFSLIISLGSSSILVSYLLAPYYYSKTEGFTHIFVIYVSIGITITSLIFATELMAQLNIITNFMHQLISETGQFLPIVAATWGFKSILYNNAYAQICASMRESKLSALCPWTERSNFYSQMYRACCRTNCYDDGSQFDHCYHQEPFGWSSHQINRQIWLIFTVSVCTFLTVLIRPHISSYHRRLRGSLASKSQDNDSTH